MAREHTLYTVNSFNFLQQRIWSILVNVVGSVEKKVYSAAVCWSVLQMTIKSSWLTMVPLSATFTYFLSTRYIVY